MVEGNRRRASTASNMLESRAFWNSDARIENSDLLLSESVELTSFSLDLDACLVNLFSREILSHGLLRAISSAGFGYFGNAFPALC